MADPTTRDKDVPTQERLDELEERIDRARRKTEDEVPGMGDDDAPRYIESGEAPTGLADDDEIPPAE